MTPAISYRTNELPSLSASTPLLEGVLLKKPLDYISRQLKNPDVGVLERVLSKERSGHIWIPDERAQNVARLDPDEGIDKYPAPDHPPVLGVFSDQR